MLRAVLSGNVSLFEDALGDLADMPQSRVHGIIRSRSMSGFRALYEKAGLPASTYPAFREAVEALRTCNTPTRRAVRAGCGAA